MGEGTETACPYAGEHPAIEVRLTDLERRVAGVEATQELKWEKLWDAVSKVGTDLANLRGRVAGYLLAAGVLGAVVAIVAQVLMAHVGH